jgi:hypothetical protein
MKLLLFVFISTFAIVGINAYPHFRGMFPNPNINAEAFGEFQQNVDPRLAPNFSPVPVWGRQSWWGTGNSYAGFTGGPLTGFYFNNDPATIAVSVEQRVIWINETNSWIWIGPEFSCISSPGYAVYTVHYTTNESKAWTSTDEINGYNQVVEMSKTLGDDRYTTVSTSTLAIPAKGATVTINIRPNLPYTKYQTVIVVDDANNNNYFQGTVVSYTGRQLTLKVLLAVGSGTISLWDVYVSGDQVYTGPSYDMSSCNTPISNTFITDSAGYLKSWAGWELYDILEQPGEVDYSVSVAYIDTIYPGEPPAHFLVPPPGCNAANTNDYCVANRELSGEFPVVPPYPGSGFVSPFLPH